MVYYLTIKDKKSRVRFARVEFKKFLLNYLLNSSLNEENKKLVYVRYMKRQKYKNSLSHIYKRCLINFRARSVFRMFKMSRIQIKHYAGFGQVIGLTKSSW